MGMSLRRSWGGSVSGSNVGSNSDNMAVASYSRDQDLGQRSGLGCEFGKKKKKNSTIDHSWYQNLYPWLRYWLVARWHQANTWTNADLLSIGPSGTKFNEILIKYHIFSQGIFFQNIVCKMAAILLQFNVMSQFSCHICTIHIHLALWSYLSSVP